MRGRLRLAVPAAALALAAFAVMAPAGARGGGSPAGVAHFEQARWAPGQIIVRFRPWVDSLSRRQTLAEHRSTTIRQLGLRGLELVRISRGESVPAAVAAFRADPLVGYAGPDHREHALATPNDPQYGSLWGLAKINAPAAWDIQTGSSSVKVAVVDTGIAATHEDLASNVDPTLGHDYVGGDSDPSDANGHGTHVAGTIGAVGDNGTGVTGVNWKVDLIPLRALDGSGSGLDSDITQAFLSACADGARVVNASLGGDAYDAAMSQAIASAGCANTLFVFAAGNGGTDGIGDNNDATPTYPCNYGSSAPGQGEPAPPTTWLATA